MSTDPSVTHKLVERLSTWRGTALFHARDGRSLRGLVVRLFENDPQRAREVVLAAMHRAIAVSHPVIDLALPESERGGLVMVSDIWPGQLLEKRLEGGPLPLGQALDVARNLAAGLGALHRTGLAHGGVHPANIWLAEDGAVRLLGLGLAGADDRPLGALAAHEVAYLPPEVLRGGEAGPAGDIWGLGIVLRECLTGWNLYSGQRTTQVIRHILDDSFTHLSGQAPDAIEQFLTETLRGEPEERLADGDAAHRALLEVPDFLPIDPTRPLHISSDENSKAPDLPRVIEGPVDAGDRIHGYQVLETLGRGGMGVVYRARDLRLERDVALKFLPLHVGEKQREDFEREARAASSLDHPNICTIYGIDESPDGDTYIAMACYDAPSLGQRLEPGPLDLDDALRIGEQIASGLGAAHRIGLVHRDIKPGNILFSRDGVVKIVDFGLSAIAEPGSGVIETEELYGTLGYVAPEILRHQTFDARADIWALGVVLFEMVSGRRPFQGQELLHFIEVLEDEPPRLGQIVPEAPDELEKIVAKALAKDPAKRYTNADEVAADLRRLRLGEPEPERGRRRIPIAIVLALLWIVAGLWFWQATTKPPTALPIAFAGIDVEQAPVWAGLALEELLRLELEARSRQTKRAPSSAREAFEEYTPAEGWPAETLERLFGDAQEILMAGRLVTTAPTDAESAADALAEGATDQEGEPLFTALLATQGRQQAIREASAEGLASTLPDVATALAEALLGAAPEPDPIQVDLTTIEPGGRFADAYLALMRLDSPAALALLEELGEKTDPLGLLLCATGLYDLGREQEAQAALDGLEPSRFADPWRLYLSARRHDLSRNYPNAAALYRLLIERQELELLPESARYAAASALVRGGDPDAALSLVANDDDPRADLLRADAYYWLAQYEQQLQAVDQATDKARRDDLPFLAARAERLRSVALWRSGDLDGGLVAVRKSAELYRALEHVKGQADAAMSQGILHYEKGELILAKDSYDRSSRLYASLGNRRAEARTLTNKALVLEQQGDLGAYMEVTERALDLFRQREDLLAELMTRVNSATPLAQLGRLEEAEAAFRSAGALAEQVGRFESWVSSSHAGFLLTTGDLAGARSKLELARRGQQLAGDEIGLATTRSIEAQLALTEGELQRAHELYEDALPVLERGSPGQLSIALRGRAELALAEGDLAKASQVLDRAAGLRSPRLEHIHVSLAQAEVALAGGELEAARRLALEALAEFQLRRVNLPAARALTALARMALEDGDGELALLRLQELEEKSQMDPATTLPRPLEQEIQLVRLRAQSPVQDGVDRRPELQALLAEVLADGSIPLELDIRLALGEAELRAGHEAAAKQRLADLASEASLKGFRALAERAERVQNDFTD